MTAYIFACGYFGFMEAGRVSASDSVPALLALHGGGRPGRQRPSVFSRIRIIRAFWILLIETNI